MDQKEFERELRRRVFRMRMRNEFWPYLTVLLIAAGASTKVYGRPIPPPEIPIWVVVGLIAVGLAMIALLEILFGGQRERQELRKFISEHPRETWEVNWTDYRVHRALNLHGIYVPKPPTQA